MVDVGLHPSHTGQPGGNVVGQNMTHFIIDDGPFDRAFKKMPEDILLPWTSSGSLEEAKKKRVAKRKTAYSCGSCGARVWGKAGLVIVCGTCEQPFEQEAVEDDGEGGEGA